MTTLDIGILQVNNPHLKNKTLEEVKAFLTQVLERDLITNMSIRKKSKWDKIDEQIRSLKVTNQESAKELEESLSIFGKEAQKAGYIEHLGN